MATIKVMSGGAPKEGFGELTPPFEAKTGHKVEYVFAVMSALRDRITGGEKADVLVMPANVLDGYQQSGVVRSDGRGMLASRAIVFATPGATPSGTHMGKLIEQFGIADAMKGRIIQRPALEGGVDLVRSGAADVG